MTHPLLSFAMATARERDSQPGFSHMAAPSKLLWYAHRLKAMSLPEIASRLAERWKHQGDAAFAVEAEKLLLGECADALPMLPDPRLAPKALRDRLARDARELLQGNWLLYGWRSASTGAPPCWHRDASTGVVIEPDGLSYKLDHRDLQDGADARTIWEINRWSEMTRVVMHGWLNHDADAVRTAQIWVEDWVERNPLARGINWTSPLEASLRLINFCWFDALVHACGHPHLVEHQRRLAQRIVPAHVAWVSRYRSFGSSANNHLLGEVAGLLHAVRRWPDMQLLTGPPEELWACIEACVGEQFAVDGGNREQALHYHLFAWEMAWHSARLMGAEDGATMRRLRMAAEFFVRMIHPLEPWDYGDSDDAQVLPVVLNRGDAMSEWQSWLAGHEHGRSLGFWMGASPLADHHGFDTTEGWWRAKESGMAVCERGRWVLRFNLAATGYGSIAAHGHCDALHVSIWDGPEALVIDPGTGSYYGMKERRNELAAWDAHNGPLPAEGYETPRRIGTFLLSGHYDAPIIDADSGRELSASFRHEGHEFTRRVGVDHTGAVQVDDRGKGEFKVRWIFAPECVVEEDRDLNFFLQRGTRRWNLEIIGEHVMGCQLGEQTVSRRYGQFEQAMTLEFTARGEVRSEWRRI